MQIKVIVWLAKDCQRHGIAIIEASCTAKELISPITQINIASPSRGDMKVVHSSKVRTGEKIDDMGRQIGELYWLHVRNIGYSLGLCDM